MSTFSMPKDVAILAHRGYAAHYPENTLAAMEAALQAGAQYLETDIQLSADGIPYLFHDETLIRTTGHAGKITELNAAEIDKLDASEAVRLENRFINTPIPRLTEFVDLLMRWPDCMAFIEIKQESISHFGLDAIIKPVLAQLTSLGQRAVIISYNADCIDYVKNNTNHPTGWVITTYNKSDHNTADHLAPDYLICNHRKLLGRSLWKGPWKWVMYEITNANTALQLVEQGVTLLETMAFTELSQILKKYSS